MGKLTSWPRNAPLSSKIPSLYIKRKRQKHTKWSTDVNLFPLAYKSQTTKTFEFSSFDMVFNRKPRKHIMFTANSSEDAQAYCQSNKISNC